MSLNPTPGSGKSGTSRTRVLKSIPATRARLLDEAPDVAAQEKVGELLSALREALEVAEGRLPPLHVARPERRCDHRIEEAALTIGRRAEGTQVARIDSEAGERLARCGDVRLALGVEPLPVL